MARDPSGKIRVAASADLHCREDDHGRFRNFVKHVNSVADVLLLCGDLTDRGIVEEARTLAEELSGLRIPCAAVLGNHDCDHGLTKEITELLAKVSVRVLDGDRYVFEKVLGVAGIKGFAGGFENATLQAFGEPQIKAFVQESVSESLKLEAALGTSRLCGPINRYGADAIFHGHAHHGSLKGQTDKGVPVYNVAMPLLKQHTPEQRFALVEI